jgi:NAD(P)-dependent dehydrogenase (short-subunit alcohol dehydrogenase family)
MGRLEGKVAFITGSGLGIGRAGAVLFAREGARVIVADNSREGGEQTVAMVREAGGEANYIHTDVTDADSVERAIASSIAVYGELNVLYNAGGSTAQRDRTGRSANRTCQEIHRRRPAGGRNGSASPVGNGRTAGHRAYSFVSRVGRSPHYHGRCFSGR